MRSIIEVVDSIEVSASSQMSAVRKITGSQLVTANWKALRDHQASSELSRYVNGSVEFPVACVKAIGEGAPEVSPELVSGGPGLPQPTML